jgi:hypothetical protein
MDEAVATLDAPDELMELVFFAMDYGIANVRGGGPLIPSLNSEPVYITRMRPPW